jgi:serine/threonine protein kinase
MTSSLSESLSDERIVIRFNELLGTGAMCSVRVGVTSKGKPVAVKIFDLLDPPVSRAFHNEVSIYDSIMQLDDNQYFAKAYYTNQQSGLGMIVMKQYDCDLYEYAKSHSLTHDRLRCMFRRICEGVQVLHNNGFAHLDIKPENILMKSGKPYLSDYGGSVNVQSRPDRRITNTNLCATPQYAAPEVMRSSEYFCPFKADIYSLGVLLHTMLTRHYPLKSKARVVLSRSGLSESVCDLMDRTLSLKPRKRPSISRLLAHPWLAPVM